MSVKVTDAGGHLGLPGMTVQLMDPWNPDAPLVQAATDAAGNAVLSFPAETAKELDTLHTAFRVVDATGKALQRIPGGACIRLHQAETKVIPLADAPETQSSQAAAQALRTQREEQAQRVRARSICCSRSATAAEGAGLQNP